MKRTGSFILAMCLSVEMLAGCGGEERVDEEQQGEQQEVQSEESTQEISFGGYSFAIPESWEEGDSTENTLYFYPETGMLMIQFSPMEGESILDEAVQEEFTQGFSASYENFELVDESIIPVAEGEAYQQVMNLTSNDTNYQSTMVTYDCQGGWMTFAMFAVQDGDTYSQEFERILDSIEKVTVESVMAKLEESGIPIEYKIIYTDETDPNGADNHDYLEKGNFADSRIEENYSEEEPLSGSIEVFRTNEEAITRADYLESLSALDSFAYRIISGNVLLRLNDNYTDEQIQEFVNIIGGSIHSKSSSDFGDLQENLNQAEEPQEAESLGYSSGMYKIGTDMPAEEYLITSSSGYYEVTSDSTGSFESIITNDNYTNRAYITVQEGQYFSFDGTATPVGEAAAYSSVDGTYPEGMYLVGKDIPAGEYKLSSSGSGYYEVTSDSTGNFDSIVSNDNFEGDKYLTISDGQYLKLNRAQIVAN